MTSLSPTRLPMVSNSLLAAAAGWKLRCTLQQIADGLSAAALTKGRLGCKEVDGFTVDEQDRLLVGAWGKGHITVVNTQRMEIERDIDMPVRIPTSCSFCGEDMKTLAITTASYRTDLDRDPLAGFLFLMPMEVGGKLPYLFG